MPSKAQIKVSALCQLLKEYREYIEDEARYEATVHSLEAVSPRDEYEIRRAKAILEETVQVRQKVLQMVKEHAQEIKRSGEARSGKAQEALEAAARLEERH